MNDEISKNDGIVSHKKRRCVQITITERCNLNCIYCYEKNKDCRSLSVEQIKSIVEEAFKNSDNFDEIEFDFHGGEIALSFETLKEVCEWIWTQNWSKPYICFACTNGTLIHGEIQQWFCKNRNRFWLGLSIDGTRDMHNTNRSNSYDQIDFEFFKRCWPKQGAKMTISPKTLPYLANGIKHIVKLGFPFSANLAYGVEWNKNMLDTYKQELMKLVDFYLENPELEIPNLLNFPMRQVGWLLMYPERSNERHKWCGSGEGMICYGPDGKTYPCQVFMPSATSEAQAEEARTAIWKTFDFGKAVVDDPGCADCILRGACPVCYGHNYLATGTLWKRPKDMCEFRKIEALATSCLQGKMLQDYTKYAYTRNLPEYDRMAIARGILAVQEQLF